MLPSLFQNYVYNIYILLYIYFFKYIFCLGVGTGFLNNVENIHFVAKLTQALKTTEGSWTRHQELSPILHHIVQPWTATMYDSKENHLEGEAQQVRVVHCASTSATKAEDLRGKVAIQKSGMR